MKYNDYLKRISNQFKTRFDEIDPEFNFDQGNEFEIHLATLFSELLPDKYGVCRGFVTPQDGKQEGDDIIIFDKFSFPLLKPNNQPPFTIKESVPVESTYAYIEAKNTLELIKKDKGNSIHKAVSQVKTIKSIPREVRSINDGIDGITLGQGFNYNLLPGDPQILNPMYGVVFSRGVRKNGKIINDPKTIRDELRNIQLPANNSVDLIIAGKDVVIIPTKTENNSALQKLEGPFFVEKRHNLTVLIVPDLAYGFGITMVQWALQKIKLNPIDWRDVLGEAIITTKAINKL